MCNSFVLFLLLLTLNPFVYAVRFVITGLYEFKNIHRMSAVMEELLAESKIELLKEGTVITGTIMEIRPTEVVIDFGGKAEGTIPAHEFLDLGELEIGSDLEIFLERLEDRDGNPQLSFDKAEQKKNWEKIVNTCEEGSVITGRVRQKLKVG